MTPDEPEKTNRRGTNPKSLANLAPPFPPGVSANPGGMAKGKKLSTCLRDMLELNMTQLLVIAESPSRPVRERIAAKWALKMMGRVDTDDVDMRAIETALDRHEGSVAQTMNIKNPADRAGKSDAELAAIMARCQKILKPKA